MGDNRNHGSGIGRGLVLVLIGVALIAIGFSSGGRWSGFSFNFNDSNGQGFHNPSWDTPFWNTEENSTIEDIEDDWSIEDLEEGPGATDSAQANDESDNSDMTQSRSGILTDDLENVEIDLRFARLTIKSGTKPGYRTEGFARGSLSVSASNTSIRITERNWRAKTFFDKNGYRPSVELILPEGKLLEECSISVGAGTVHLNDIACTNFRVESGAGSISGTNITASDAKLESGAGKLEFSDSSFTDATMSSGAGHIGFSGSLGGRTKIETGVGSMYLELSGTENDYRINFERGLGSVRIGGQSFNGTGEGRTGPSEARSVIDVTTGIGEVRISFDGNSGTSL